MFETQVAYGLGGGLATMVEKSPGPAGRIADSLQKQHKLGEVLLQEINVLEQRLSMALRPTGPQGASSNGREAQTQSELSSAFDVLNGRIEAAIQRIRDISNRVDF
jgi:hypothetical protein